MFVFRELRHDFVQGMILERHDFDGVILCITQNFVKNFKNNGRIPPSMYSIKIHK
jgi:hypothetical protein